MTRTLLGLSASPRKGGNCELIIKETFRQLGDGWQLQLLRLHDLDLRPCRGCYQCLFDAGRCPIDDDFAFALEALCAADAWVVAAPAYFLGANASLKRFLDRGLCFYAHLERLWGKPAVAVTVAGIEGMEGHTPLDLAGFVRLSLADLRAARILYGALPGEVLLQGRAENAARELAAALRDELPAPPPAGPHCPLCGGDSFRFVDGTRLRCLLCSSSGHYRWQDGRLQVSAAPGNHPLFLSRAAALRHADWLRGMKDAYLTRREELKAAARPYAGLGTVLRPDRKRDEDP